MAAPGTIIGQIQPTAATPGTITQVTGTPAQIQQLQQGAQQTVTLSSPQQVALPATVPSVKEEQQVETTTAESTVQNSTAETIKENTEGKLILNLDTS